MMFATKKHISLFLLVGLSSLTHGSLLMNYPIDDHGSWHRNNFLNFANWDPFEDDPFEMDFFHDHHLYFPRIHRAHGVRQLTVVHPLVKRNDRDNFQLFMDVDGFDPNELSLKLVGRELLIKGVRTCNENQQKPCFRRRFCWRRTLPEDVDMSSVRATLTKPNALEIEAKKIKDYESDIQIDVRGRSVNQVQPTANHKAENQFEQTQRVGQDSSKGDEDAIVEIVPDENFNSDPQ